MYRYPVCTVGIKQVMKFASRIKIFCLFCFASFDVPGEYSNIVTPHLQVGTKVSGFSELNFHLYSNYPKAIMIHMREHTIKLLTMEILLKDTSDTNYTSQAIFLLLPGFRLRLN